MNKQLHGEFARYLNDAGIDVKVDQALLFDANKRLLRTSEANIHTKPESYGLQRYKLIGLIEQESSRRRSINVLPFRSTNERRVPALVRMMIFGVVLCLWGLRCTLSLKRLGIVQQNMPATQILSQKMHPESHTSIPGHRCASLAAPGVSHENLPGIYATRQADFNLNGDGRSQKLPGAWRPRAQQSHHILCGISRAPPVAV